MSPLFVFTKALCFSLFRVVECFFLQALLKRRKCALLRNVRGSIGGERANAAQEFAVGAARSSPLLH